MDSPSGVKTLKDGMVMWLDIRTDSVGMRSPGHPWPHVKLLFPYLKWTVASGDLHFSSVPRCVSCFLLRYGLNMFASFAVLGTLSSKVRSHVDECLAMMVTVDKRMGGPYAGWLLSFHDTMYLSFERSRS